MKTIYILAGPKGSGKSFIGRLMEKRLGVPFLVVENMFLEFQNQGLDTAEIHKRGFEKAGKTIGRIMKNTDALAFETTGASPLFSNLLERLRLHYDIKLIAVRASAKVCLERIKQRDQSSHMPVNDSLINEIHRISTGLALDYTLTIQNENLNETDLVGILEGLVKRRAEGAQLHENGKPDD